MSAGDLGQILIPTGGCNWGAKVDSSCVYTRCRRDACYSCVLTDVVNVFEVTIALEPSMLEIPSTLEIIILILGYAVFAFVVVVRIAPRTCPKCRTPTSWSWPIGIHRIRFYCKKCNRYMESHWAYQLRIPGLQAAEWWVRHDDRIVQLCQKKETTEEIMIEEENEL